jgi:type II secretory pathway component PulL
MSETLVIRLRAAEDAPASWLIVDSNGAASGAVQSGPVADALNLSVGRRVVLLLPGSDVTLAQPELPLRGGAKRLRSKNSWLRMSTAFISPSALKAPATLARRSPPFPNR